MRIRFLGWGVAVLPLLAVAACEPAEDVRVQELPPLERAAVEARLGLPMLTGSWPFAGWELAEGDTLGMESELPVFGGIRLNEQKRDSLGGVYVGAAGATVPLSGEVRRNGVVALVAFPSAQDGRYLVGSVEGDTLWLESSSLAPAGSWRRAARAAFVRGAASATPFRRIRGMVAVAPPPADTADLTVDTIPAEPGGLVGAAPAAGAQTAGAPAQPSLPGGPPAAEPTAEVESESAEQVEGEAGDENEEEERDAEPAPRPAPTPAVQQREPPRVLGEPVQRDDGNLP